MSGLICCKLGIACGKARGARVADHVRVQTKGLKTVSEITPSEVRAYVLRLSAERWQEPVCEQIFSAFSDGRPHVCMTRKGINYFWHDGQLTSCGHTAETKERYNLLLQPDDLPTL